MLNDEFCIFVFYAVLNDVNDDVYLEKEKEKEKDVSDGEDVSVMNY